MKNNEYNTHRVKEVCQNKLEIEFRDGKEYNGWFKYEGTRVARITVPHGRKPIPPKTYKSMAVQLKLSLEQFDDLLDCPLKLHEYISILKSQRVIPS